jgi:hypothetical protein
MGGQSHLYYGNLLYAFDASAGGIAEWGFVRIAPKSLALEVDQIINDGGFDYEDMVALGTHVFWRTYSGTGGYKVDAGGSETIMRSSYLSGRGIAQVDYPRSYIIDWYLDNSTSCCKACVDVTFPQPPRWISQSGSWNWNNPSQ